MAGIQRRAHQFGLEGLAVFQVVGQLLQHHAQVAAVLTRTDHGAVDVGKLARVLAQRAGEGGARIHLGAQGGHQVALALVVGLVAQGGECPLQRQA